MMKLKIEEIKQAILQNYKEFGVNKAQEVLRLVYEIVKREGVALDDVFEEAPRDAKKGSHRFMHLKKYLLMRRFPNLSEGERNSHGLFKELNLKPENKSDKRSCKKIEPSHFIVEESVLDTDLVKRLKGKYSKAKYDIVSTYKESLRERQYSLVDFNKRLDEFYIVRENYDFFLECPCSAGSVPCGYNTMNLGIGCGFDCAYCFLQGYINSPGIIIQANIEDYFEKFKMLNRDMRLGTGQFTDSLVFDHITEYSPLIVEFFKQYPKSTFEFKTKSNNVDLLMGLNPSENIMVSWTLNPQKIVDEVEFSTNSLEERLQAAIRCVDAGYKVGFHFDPVIVYNGWQNDYRQVVDRLFDLVDEKRIGWISLGALRMTADLKQVIENRFPQTTILDGELVSGYDDKLRYSKKQRADIYSTMKGFVRGRSENVLLYLCMEEEGLCQECKVITKEMQKF